MRGLLLQMLLGRELWMVVMGARPQISSKAAAKLARQLPVQQLTLQPTTQPSRQVRAEVAAAAPAGAAEARHLLQPTATHTTAVAQSSRSSSRSRSSVGKQAEVSLLSTEVGQQQRAAGGHLGMLQHTLGLQGSSQQAWQQHLLRRLPQKDGSCSRRSQPGTRRKHRVPSWTTPLSCCCNWMIERPAACLLGFA